MLILICDDLDSDRQILKDFCLRYGEENSIDTEILQFENAGALLKSPRTLTADILFLDIYMEGASGVDAARILRGRGFTKSLVFTTTSREHYASGFDLEAIHYLVKPVNWEAFCESMRRCLGKTKKSDMSLRVSMGRSDISVDISGIRYIEVYGHKTIINTVKGELTVTQSLSSLEEALQSYNFLRCYRCFLINMDYIQRVEKDFFLMKDNREIPISRDNRTQLKSHYLEYLFSKMEETT